MNILAIAILDRQGRGTVEGIVVTVFDSLNLRGVDRDGVALGVGVISGGVAFGAFGVFVFFEILKLPIDSDGSAGDCIRGHAGRQRVVDRAAGKTGGDVFGDRRESLLQPVEVISRVGLAGGDIVVQIVEESDICICVRIRHFLVSSTKADGVERITIAVNFRCLVFGCLEGFFIAVLAITIGINYVSESIVNIMSVRSVIIGRFAVGQRNDVLRSYAADSAVAKQVLSLGKALLQIGAAVGTQAVDGGQNIFITRVGGNVLPSRCCYFCVCTETDQRNIAAGAADSIAIKEIDGRGLGGSQTVAVTAATCSVRVLLQAATGGGFVIRLIGFIVDTYTVANNMMIDFFYTQMCIVALYSCGNVAAISVLMLRQQAVRHRAGGIDDEHRCGLRVAGLSRGGRVHFYFQLDVILIRVACGSGFLGDIVDIWGRIVDSKTHTIILFPFAVNILTIDWQAGGRRVIARIRQHVERQ